MKHTILSAGVILTLAGAGHSAGFDPNKTCGELVNEEDSNLFFYAGQWSEGVRAAITGELRHTDLNKALDVAEAVFDLCDRDQPFVNAALDWIDQVGGGAVTAPARNMSPKEFLDQFFEADADYIALAESMKPTEAEVRKMFGPDTADGVVAYVEEIYERIMQVGGLFPDDPNGFFEIDYVSTTGKERDRVLAEGGSPSGYKRIAASYLIDVPVFDFEFINAGDDNGISYTGLYQLDGRFIWIPKVQRSLR